MEPPHKPIPERLASLNRVLKMAAPQTTHVMGRAWNLMVGESLQPEFLHEHIKDIFRSFESAKQRPIWPLDSSEFVQLEILRDHIQRIYDPSPVKTAILDKLEQIRDNFFFDDETSLAEKILNQIEFLLSRSDDLEMFPPFPRNRAGKIINPRKVLDHIRCILRVCLCPKDYNLKDSTRHYPEHDEILRIGVHSDEIPLDKYLDAIKAVYSTTLKDKGGGIFVCKGILHPLISRYDGKDMIIRFEGKLTYFPSTLTRLTQLESLNLLGENLLVFPTVLAKLPALTGFCTDSNANLDQIALLTQIKTLDIGSSTRLQEDESYPRLPETLFNLTQLKSLVLTFCNPNFAEAPLYKLKNLSKLFLSRCNLEELPRCIGELSQLALCDVSSNRLTALPEEIGHLDKLEAMYFVGNVLTSLPFTLGCLRSLKQIHCGIAHLTLLPHSMLECSLLAEISTNDRDPTKRWSAEDPTPLREFLLTHNPVRLIKLS